MSIKKGDTVEWINESHIYQAENGARALVIESPNIYSATLEKWFE